jgi:transposase
MMLEEMVDDVPPIRQSWGRPRRRLGKLHADKAYDHRRCRQVLTRRRIQPRITRRDIGSSAKLGQHRWAEARTLARISQFRRLAVRYKRRADIHAAFLTLASAIIAWRLIQRWFR